ncbi:MAG TPA: helix-turn-helix domain-containing protein [Candidatus Butyricicoccus avicola]|nr:helix-turn-helix domain-containing protein [Candidatus Butyricicoccus avicola]
MIRSSATVKQREFLATECFRLQAACRLLEEGYMPVTEIGQLCGLGSGSYFGKVFREAFRCTPQS